MDSRLVLKWHIRVFKLCAMWPPEDKSIYYRVWTVLFTLFVSIAYPISQIVCCFWVDSIDEIIDHLIVTSTITMAAIKGLNVLAKKGTFMELFRLMNELDATITPEEYEKNFKQKFRLSNVILLIFSSNYLGCWVVAAIQDTVVDPTQKLWSSTYLYPNEFLHRRDIYIGGIIYQAVSNLLLVMINFVVDTYGASLLHILGGHIEVLGQRLRALGRDSENIKHQEKAMIELCKKYVLIIRYSKLLEDILSFALFSQFGVSGFVLCTCAYQLSVLSPVDDTYKFFFTVIYSFAMLIQIFVPSYFGADVFMKSEKLSYENFKSNWIPTTTKYKRSMQILIERTFKPISIRAAGVFMLDLNTLLKILKTAYSIFAMLKNARE